MKAAGEVGRDEPRGDLRICSHTCLDPGQPPSEQTPFSLQQARLQDSWLVKAGQVLTEEPPQEEEQTEQKPTGSVFPHLAT